MPSIYFITDGGAHLGLGHVQQSISFATELKLEAQISFLTKSDPAVCDKIKSSDFPVTATQSDEEILKHLKTADPDIVIFDKLDVAAELAERIKKETRARLVIFTNLTDANRYADIAVTADIGSRFENVRFVDDQTNTEYFYGPRYWVLRKEFYDYHILGKPQINDLERVLLIFGGSDPANLTSAALEQLLQLDHVLNIDVIIGSHFTHTTDLQDVIERYPQKRERISIHCNIRNVAELMHGTDLVLASPGLSAFEALKVGTPVIVVPHDDLQRKTYQGFMRMLGREQLHELGRFLAKRDFTYPHDKHIARMQIGDGISELKCAILNKPDRDVL